MRTLDDEATSRKLMAMPERWYQYTVWPAGRRRDEARMEITCTAPVGRDGGRLVFLVRGRDPLRLPADTPYRLDAEYSHDDGA